MSTAPVPGKVRSGFRSVARLDWAEVRRSRWLLLCIVLYGFLCGAFVLVGMRESSFMGFTGTGRVLLSLVHALLLLLPLLALMATGQVIVSSRLDGTLELLFSAIATFWPWPPCAIYPSYCRWLHSYFSVVCCYESYFIKQFHGHSSVVHCWSRRLCCLHSQD